MLSVTQKKFVLIALDCYRVKRDVARGDFTYLNEIVVGKYFVPYKDRKDQDIINEYEKNRKSIAMYGKDLVKLANDFLAENDDPRVSLEKLDSESDLY